MPSKYGEVLKNVHISMCRDIKHMYPLCTKSVNADLALQESQVERKHTFTDPKTGQEATISVTYERFLAPEIFFNPSIAKLTVPPIPKLVDAAIQSCAIDSRRKLYSTICLSVCIPHLYCPQCMP
jgi:actin-related protein